jgi:hypothetical protein
MGGASAAMADEVDVTASSPTGTSVTLGAGTYDVSEIAGVYTSANLWLDDLNASGQSTSCTSPSTCTFGFRPSFDISVNGGSPASYSIPVAEGAYLATYDTAADALAAFQAYEAVNPISFTLTSASTVNFVVPDVPNDYWDNSGGVSLSVVPATPEPSTWLLMIGGVAGAGLMLRRAKKAHGDVLNNPTAI